MIVRDYRLKDSGFWEMLIAVETKDGEKLEWCGCTIIDVPVENILLVWEDLINELSLKETALCKKKEVYDKKEFEIVFMDKDIDFKAIYGSTSEKVRKHHAKNELNELDDKINSLELSINWIKNYMQLLKEVIRSKNSTNACCSDNGVH